MGWIITGKAMHNKLDSLLAYVPDLRKDKFIAGSASGTGLL